MATRLKPMRIWRERDGEHSDLPRTCQRGPALSTFARSSSLMTLNRKVL